MLRSICVVTGTRAEYGLLYWLMRSIAEDADLTLQIIVTGMHLELAFGHTVDYIREDGFTVDAEVSIELSSDAPVAIAHSTGLAVTGIAELLKRLRPDVVVLLGDRFETFAAATAATLMRVPIAHIHGGEISEGAIDDALRHAITKMSHVHFVANEDFRRRVIQMGEPPDQVFNVGALGLDNLVRITLPDRTALAARLGLSLDRPMFLITYHPATLDDTDVTVAVEELLSALQRFPQAALVFTKANADAGGRAINERLATFVSHQPHRAVLVSSLMQDYYLGALCEAAVVIGNSSSGIIEAPAAGTPTVNLGIRQQGRPRAAGIIDCPEERDAIAAAIVKALDPAMQRKMANGDLPYGRPRNAAVAIVERLRELDPARLVRKRFWDLREVPVS